MCMTVLSKSTNLPKSFITEFLLFSKEMRFWISELYEYTWHEYTNTLSVYQHPTSIMSFSLLQTSWRKYLLRISVVTSVEKLSDQFSSKCGKRNLYFFLPYPFGFECYFGHLISRHYSTNNVCSGEMRKHFVKKCGNSTLPCLVSSLGVTESVRGKNRGTGKGKTWCG